MKRHQRNGNIELLRFIFAVCIMLFHADMAFDSGYLGVEFFLILTGYFLGRKICAHRDTEISWTGAFRESTHELLKRYFSIFPYLLPSTVIGFIIQCVINYKTPEAILKSMKFLVGDFLLVQNFALPTDSATGVVWYLGAMLYALWLLYPLLRKAWSAFLYVAPVISLTITGILLYQCGSLNVPNTVLFGWINTGFLRAISAISAGVFLFALQNLFQEHLRQNLLPVQGRVLVTILEILLYVSVFQHMNASADDSGASDGIALFALSAAFFCTVSRQSFSYGLFDNAFCRFLGQFSIPLFLNHYYWVVNRQALLDLMHIQCSDAMTSLAAITLTVLTSTLVMFTGKMIGKQIKKIRQSSIFSGHQFKLSPDTRV